jgi:hypothetical protein
MVMTCVVKMDQKWLQGVPSPMRSNIVN